VAELLNIDPERLKGRHVSRAVEGLRRGGVLIYPTDTVYGLGADATNPDAVARVRAIKGRDAHKPILAMVSDMDMLERYAEVTPLARTLAARFLPGALTLVLTPTEGVLASTRAYAFFGNS